MSDFNLAEYLSHAESVILPSRSSRGHHSPASPDGRLHVGVDLGTSYLVVVALDEKLKPLAGEYQFAQVVRDGLVVDFIGAIDRLKGMKARLEKRLGHELTHAASGYPPGVPRVEVRAIEHVLEAAGLTCTGMIDEPTAANNLLALRDGAIVDVGGGTTGIAVFKDGKVVYSADEPTGGTHFSLVIAGAKDISFEEAEALKIDPAHQEELFLLIRPVMEKVASIIAKHLKGKDVKHITMVGGTACYPGITKVVQEYTGIHTSAPERPLFVTPLGIAMHDKE